MNLVLLMKLMNWDQRREKLKFDEEATYGSKFILIKRNKVINAKHFHFSTQKEDEIEEYLKKRYADESIARRHFGDGGEEMSDEITQQTLLPTIKYDCLILSLYR